jgi:cytochrome P450
MAAMASPISFSDPALLADPYPSYQRLRVESPVCWDAKTANGCWLVARHADVTRACRDARLSSNRAFAYRSFLPQDEDGRRLGDTIEGFLAFKDPPDHTRLRALVNRAFTPRALEALRSRILALVDDLLDAAIARGRLRLIGELAYPLPVTVIGDMLGVPPADADRLKPWADDIAMFLGAMKGLKRALASTREIEAYMADLVAQRRVEPRDDMLGALVAAEVDGQRLTDAEIFQMAYFLLLAGHHTTMNLIGNGMLALLQHPDQLARLRENPGLVPTAVEEMLRWDSPVQSIGRVPKEDVEIGGTHIAAGQLVVLLLGAANRDEEAFADADRFLVARETNKHVAFAGGAHFCVGAPLSRLEAQLVFARILQRFRRIELAGPIEWVPNVNFRGLRELELEVGS